MNIIWSTDCNAPGCKGVIVAQSPAERDPTTGKFVPNRDSETNSKLIQTDWDYPGVASSFGWSLRSVQNRPEFCCNGDAACDDVECAECKAATAARTKPDCDHSGTDGTIDCPDCGVTASEFIEAAGEWLDENDGATAEDPGYFNG